jgi:hypothetical protein
VRATAYDQRVSDKCQNAAYLTGAVHRDELPILVVIHESDGDWQFLDGGAVEDDDAVAIHVGHVLDTHPDLRHLVDLPEGWAAERDSVSGEWRRYAWPTE